ncbi:hypothetical protein G7Y89_g5195 [Cudoniella acicularis]|uniref:Heterokaryon incompatibility domain-containing protein n=1 Tax=Cudoniella acicularis TaxID=354080 RepID=A0A8H4RMX6_9HELO|nr:hypothetical protein G7Y89_g5195 [Cudoniella acicularis]
MAQNSQSPLCSACKQTTFEMLLAGFEHPLTYAQTLKLQTHKSRYDVDKDYDSVTLQLAELSVVRRHFARGVLVESMEPPPEHFQWEPDNILCNVVDLSGEAFDDNGDGEALPSRLIDVGSLECAALPRLVETRSLRGRYFTLSHRWGDSLEYRTTKETLKEYKGMLPLDLMPQSFRDAMEVTRQLGFQYLWIDSICII